MDTDSLYTQLSEVDISGEGFDLFAESFANSVKVVVESMMNALDEVDDERAAELVNFWIGKYSELAYNELADSVNKSYSHVVGRIEDQARARAYRTVATELSNFRSYGRFDIRSLAHKP